MLCNKSDYVYSFLTWLSFMELCTVVRHSPRGGYQITDSPLGGELDHLWRNPCAMVVTLETILDYTQLTALYSFFNIGKIWSVKQQILNISWCFHNMVFNCDIDFTANYTQQHIHFFIWYLCVCFLICNFVCEDCYDVLFGLSVT